MKKYLLIVIVSLFMISPVFALGNLTINCTSLAPSYINTNSSANMLRAYLNVSGGDGFVNITYMNITLAGSVEYKNITSVQIMNATGSIISSNTTLNNLKVGLNFTDGLFVNSSTNTSIVIIITTNTTATRLGTVSVNINESFDILTSEADVVVINSNISTESQIQDVHATASISPKFVDTNVINQSLGYTLTPTGLDRITTVNITTPSGYTITNVNEVKKGSSVLYNSTLSDATVTFTDNMVNINYASGFNSTEGSISVNFTVNTNSTEIISLKFNSTIGGSNLTYVNTTIENVNSTNVTTKQLFDVLRITALKTAAVVNGTDYWEFSIVLNFTENVTTGGLVQFRMTNWNNSAGYIMNLTNHTASVNYTSLRLSTNANNTFNVTNSYDHTRGISTVPVQGTANAITVILKMIIPSGTPVSSTWWSTYYTLFRSSP